MTQSMTFVCGENKIDFRLGGKYWLEKVEGLNEGSVTRREDEYIDTDGLEYGDELYEPRTVTLYGFIQATSRKELFQLRQKMARILNGKAKGILKYSNGFNRYFSEAVADLPQFGERVQNILPFVVDFNLYRFYWKDDYRYDTQVFSRSDKLLGRFTFASLTDKIIVSEVIPSGTLVNSGDIKTDLIIRVKGTKTPSQTSANKGFKITNEATGEYIQLAYNISNGETVTIDTRECTITSSNGTNLMNCLHVDSTFFRLECGANRLTGSLLNPYLGISIETEHYNMRIGV